MKVGLNIHSMRDVIIYIMKRKLREGWGAGSREIKPQHVVSDYGGVSSEFQIKECRYLFRSHTQGTTKAAKMHCLLFELICVCTEHTRANKYSWRISSSCMYSLQYWWGVLLLVFLLSISLSCGNVQRQQEERLVKCIETRRKRCIFKAITDGQLNMGQDHWVFSWQEWVVSSELCKLSSLWKSDYL